MTRVKDDCDHADICVMDPRCPNFGECSQVACTACCELFANCRCDEKDAAGNFYD